ncbi:SDR family NAD(P)-dependent oxidoreductase [Companilactobacillus versmoldensis]|uniref:Daunorubicin C-13 ketoreductase n=1 Tax=Companilactobacillus versmoldensis DSM 14857 = KCTC 3814 TaxID=1423815 RepID=A0A0R1SPE5_9LACO|nr:SDR family NAD(P)-dependent oxidoreductase [Companilactobacillus versmoldensis]KRL68149.1 daunorubicin C-13 ketoreductase [Companilactobacillus versmoldensis DSM 14857 = KCTC 3814]
MSKIFITGSSDGLGLLAAKDLISKGNEVVFHARNQKRAEDIRREVPSAKEIVIGDLANQKEVSDIAKQVNQIGSMDAVIYNAGISSGNSELTFKVNVMAPYLLTALIKFHKRVVYVSSGMHVGSKLDLENLLTATDYSSSKLQIVILTKLLARKFPEVVFTAVDPGWVPTKMGDSMATDDLTLGYTTQVWLATLEDKNVSGEYFHHLKPAHYDARADDDAIQNNFLSKLIEISGVDITEN